MPVPVWQKLQRQLEQLPDFDPKSSVLRTFIFGNMLLCPLDSQNRIRLSPELCRMAELERDHKVAIGAFPHGAPSRDTLELIRKSGARPVYLFGHWGRGNPDWVGDDSFTFYAHDGGVAPLGGQSNTATVKVTIVREITVEYQVADGMDDAYCVKWGMQQSVDESVLLVGQYAAGMRFQNRHMSGRLFSSTDGDPIEKSVQPRGSRTRISSWIDIVIPEAFQPSKMMTTGIFSSRSCRWSSPRRSFNGATFFSKVFESIRSLGLIIFLSIHLPSRVHFIPAII